MACGSSLIVNHLNWMQGPPAGQRSQWFQVRSRRSATRYLCGGLRNRRETLGETVSPRWEGKENSETAAAFKDSIVEGQNPAVETLESRGRSQRPWWENTNLETRDARSRDASVAFMQGAPAPTFRVPQRRRTST